jgi:hypothetical protein
MPLDISDALHRAVGPPHKSQCNWPQGGAPGPIAISTREGIGDSGERVPISEQHTIEVLSRLSALRLMRFR